MTAFSRLSLAPSKSNSKSMPMCFFFFTFSLHLSSAEMREALIPLLLEDETVVQALRRLGGKKQSAAAAASAKSAARVRRARYVRILCVLCVCGYFC